MGRVKRTIGSELARYNGVGPGFDFLRLFLAFSVVVFHTFVVLGIRHEQLPFIWISEYWVLTMFFVLSGFLITASAQRLKLREFLVNRALRIVPALAVEVVLSGFIIAPIFTLLPLSEFFRKPDVYLYMTNIVGFVHLYLPGVFTSHVHHVVNGSLWTIPYEMACYGIMVLIIKARLFNRPLVMVWGAAAISVIGLALAIIGRYGNHEYTDWLPGKWADNLLRGQGSRLFVAFLLGIAAYLKRDSIPYSRKLYKACLVYCLIFALFPMPWDPRASFSFYFPALNLLLAAPLTYITLYIGVSEMPRFPLLHRGDYSYGIYLYSFPLQQALVEMLPRISFLALLGLEFPVICLCAAFSWHCIEKPILRLRKRFSFVARQRLQEPPEEGKISRIPFKTN